MTESLTAEQSEAVLVALTNRVSANLPLHTALTALAEESSSPQASRLLRQLDRRLQAGESPEAVIITLQERLPANVGRLLQGGLEIGRLDLLMQFLVNQKQWDREFRHRLTMGFAYPAVVLLFFIGWVLFVLLGIVPQFKRIHGDFGAELPSVTILLIGASDLLLHGGILLIPVLLGAMAGGWWWLCHGNLSWLFGRTGRAIPILGSMVTLRQFSEFCEVLAILLEGQLELPRALRLASAGLADSELQATCDELAGRIENGEPIDAAMNNLELPHSFALILRQTVSDCGRELRALATIYNTKGDFSVMTLVMAIDITVMMGVSIVIVLTLGGLFLPLITLMNHLA